MRHRIRPELGPSPLNEGATGSTRPSSPRRAGEHRWIAFSAIGLAIALQLALPERFSLGPGWLLPGTEGALALSLLIVNPFRSDAESRAIRRLGLLLVAVMSLANAYSAALLIRGVVHGAVHGGAVDLLADGAGIYATNIVAFALWYWELDSGGPMVRAIGDVIRRDFLFPQTATSGIAPDGWRPLFLDYLYVSFTNATAFSPTDTMPLSRWAKMLMLTQSCIALVTVSLVIARAVNIFQ